MFDFVIFSQNQAFDSRILCFLCAIRIGFAHLPVTAHTRKDITFSKKAPFLLWHSIFFQPNNLRRSMIQYSPLMYLILYFIISVCQFILWCIFSKLSPAHFGQYIPILFGFLGRITYTPAFDICRHVLERIQQTRPEHVQE